MNLLARLFGRSSKPGKKDVKTGDLSAAVAAACDQRRAEIFPKLKPGFTFVGTGRCGYIYFKQDSRMLEIYWETSGVSQFDYLLTRDGLNEWCYPARESLCPAQKEAVFTSLTAWLSERKIRAEL